MYMHQTWSTQPKFWSLANLRALAFTSKNVKNSRKKNCRAQIREPRATYRFFPFTKSLLGYMASRYDDEIRVGKGSLKINTIFEFRSCGRWVGEDFDQSGHFWRQSFEIKCRHERVRCVWLQAEWVLKIRMSPPQNCPHPNLHPKCHHPECRAQNGKPTRNSNWGSTAAQAAAIYAVTTRDAKSRMFSPFTLCPRILPTNV